MSYYMGDYRGDYYSGDPFWGGLLRLGSKIIKGVSGLGGGGATRVIGAPGGIAARAGGIIKRGAGAVLTTVQKHPVLSAAGAAGALGALGGGVAERELMGAGAACPKGHHISKSKHGKHYGQCVKNRHMRVTNPRALRRALRRAH